MTTIKNRKENNFDFRGYQRVDMDLPTMINLKDEGVFPAMVRNLSVTGLLLECSLNLIASSELRVLLKLNQENHFSHLLCSADVIRALSPGLNGINQYGVSFNGLNHDDRKTIDMYIHGQLSGANFREAS